MQSKDQQSDKIQAKLEEFAAEIEITEELTTFYKSVVDGTLTVTMMKKGGRDEPDTPFEQGPTIHERISAGKALAALAVRRPGTKPLPQPDVEERKRTADDVIEELERRFARAKQLQEQRQQITDGGDEDDG